MNSYVGVNVAGMMPESTEEQARWRHTREARNILYGDWLEILETAVKDAVGSTRGKVWGVHDLSANPLRSISDQLAKTYDALPMVMHEDAQGADLLKAVEDASYWLMAARLQRDAIALRESVTCVSIVDEKLNFRQVRPDQVETESAPDQPHKIIRIWEARERVIGDKKQWCWDAWDISDKDSPSFKILNGARTADLTTEVLGGKFEAEGYHWRTADGEPLIPYVVLHAAWGSELFDWRTNTEVVVGVKQLGVYYSFFGHVLRNASWEQRYMINAVLQGSGVSDDGQAKVDGDPAAILALRSLNESQPQIGSWGTSADPVKIIEAITTYERRLASYLGINASDLMRMSGDPRSGYAVAVSRESQRELMRKMTPFCLKADSEILRVAAALLGKAQGKAYPEDGYTIEYQGVPKGQAEKKEEREDVYSRLDRGLMSQIEAYQMLNPGTSEKDAGIELAMIAQEQRLVQEITNPQPVQNDQPNAQVEPKATKDDPTEAAFNGAQVTAATGIVKDVSAGLLNEVGATNMLMELFDFDKATAQSFLIGANQTKTTVEAE